MKKSNQIEIILGYLSIISDINKIINLDSSEKKVVLKKQDNDKYHLIVKNKTESFSGLCRADIVMSNNKVIINSNIHDVITTASFNIHSNTERKDCFRYENGLLKHDYLFKKTFYKEKVECKSSTIYVDYGYDEYKVKDGFVMNNTDIRKYCKVKKKNK